MARIIVVAMLYLATAVSAEAPRTHIEQLIPMEQCVYRAKLGAAASWIRIQKMATGCHDIKYLWHGDETEFEIGFIKEYTCEGFLLNKDPIKTGDTLFMQCVKELGK